MFERDSPRRGSSTLCYINCETAAKSRGKKKKKKKKKKEKARGGKATEAGQAQQRRGSSQPCEAMASEEGRK